MKKRSGRGTYLVALALFVAGMGYLIHVGFSEGRMPYINVSELLAAPTGQIGQAKVFGTVAREGLDREADGLGARFVLLDAEDEAVSLLVEYRGVLPDLFEEGAEVILEGRLVDPGSFSATMLSTKCPSKYEKANREDHKT